LHEVSSQVGEFVAREAVDQVIALLVSKRYQELEFLTRGARLPAVEIEAAVTSYGRTLALLPQSGDRRTDIVELRGSDPPSWSVVQPLRTIEEGWSDLSLELTVMRLPDGTLRIELDDIHVI
jgi:hypothetical protein